MTTTPSPTPTPDPEDAWLEKLLRRPADDPQAPRDDGAAFTAHVLAALPPPAGTGQHAARRQRLVLVSAAALLGCGVAWICGGPGLMESAHEVARLAAPVPGPVGGPQAIAVQVLAVASALAMLAVVGLRDLRRLF